MTLARDRVRVVVLISGSGSNLQALIDASKLIDCSYEIVLVISNRPDAYGLKRAKDAGIEQAALDHKAYQDRDSFEMALSECIDRATPDFIVCAGFMRVFTEAFVTRYAGRIVNIHPSLLPSFRGLNTYARALDAGVAFVGCSVHWVSAGVDEGAIIGQAIVAVVPGDKPNDLAARVLVQEHLLYPICLNLIASRRAIVRDGRNFLDGKLGAFALTGHLNDAP